LDSGPNLSGAWIVWMNYLLKLVKLCQYNSQIHLRPVTNKQSNNIYTNVAIEKHGLSDK
jgi:hypothetical protein